MPQVACFEILEALLGKLCDILLGGKAGVPPVSLASLDNTISHGLVSTFEHLVKELTELVLTDKLLQALVPYYLMEDSSFDVICALCIR